MKQDHFKAVTLQATSLWSGRGDSLGLHFATYKNSIRGFTQDFLISQAVNNVLAVAAA